MANDFNIDLYNSTLAARGITVLQNALPSLRVFSTDFSDQVMTPRSTVNVPVYSNGSAVQTNPAAFNTGDTDAANAQVVLNQYSKSFYLDNDQIQKGHKIEAMAEANMGALADKILSVTFSTLSTANYGTTTATASAATEFTVEKLKSTWGEITGRRKGIVLKDDYFANFLPSDRNSFDPTQGGLSLYGFDNFTHASSFAGADPAVVGFVAAPQAMAVASAIPMKANALGGSIASQIVEVPDLGISFEVNSWVDVNTRQVWSSFDCLYGVAVADGSALKLIKTS